jgi:hypothetical protein
MKKLSLFSIIFLLAFISINLSCNANEFFNYGNVWNSWSDYTREVYIVGYKDGIAYYISSLLLLPISFSIDIDRETILKEINYNNTLNSLTDFVDFDNKSIRNVATDLYKDPANTYIPHYKMIGIAYRKLCGDSIEPLLLEERNSVIRTESMRKSQQ